MQKSDTDFTIRHGDVLEHLRDESIGTFDTVITSPPYNCGIEYDGCTDDMEPIIYFEWIETVASLVGQRLRPGGYAIWNVPNYLGNRSERIYALDEYKSIFSRHVPFDDLIIWKKHPPHNAAWGCPPHRPRIRAEHEWLIVTHAPGGERYETGIDMADWSRWTRSVWEVLPTPHPLHPATFPLEIARRLVMLYSPAGGRVLDPFCGTGTTIQAAIACGRQGVGIDQSRTYCNVAEAACSQGNLFGSGS